MNINKITKLRLDTEYRIDFISPPHQNTVVTIEKERDRYAIIIGKKHLCYGIFKDLKEYLKTSKLLKTCREI